MARSNGCGNAGYLPSYVTKRALERKTARPCIFEIELPAGAHLRMGKPRMEGPSWKVMQPLIHFKPSCPAKPSREIGH